MTDWKRLTVLFGLYLALLTVLTLHGVGPIEAVTKIQLNTADAQIVSNKTFDSTNTFNGTIGTGTYSGTQTFSALTANSIPLLNSSKQLTSTANPTNGQVLIGSTGSVPVLGSITGTANRVTVTPGAGSITLTAPQDLHAGASPTFNALTLSTPLTIGNGGLGISGTPTNGQLLIGNGSGYTLATLTGTANRVTVTNGAGTITLNGPQDLHSAASPTFAGATLTGAVAFQGAVTSSKSCASFFTRVSPTYCQRTADADTAASWTDVSTCTIHDLGVNIPAGTKVDLLLTWQALSNNGAGDRSNTVLLYSTTDCSGARVGWSRLNVYEQAAVSAGTVLVRTQQRVIGVVATNTGNANIYATQTNAGGNGNADVESVQIVGYYD